MTTNHNRYDEAFYDMHAKYDDPRDFDDVPTQGSYCEDYPCCGHAPGECMDRKEFTSAYYLENPHLLDEEYYDYE